MSNELSFDEIVAAASKLVIRGERRILGITGAPGSGKSTLGEMLTQALGDDAVLVSLDGFHLANAELHRLGRHARKGAADTFDAAGYIAMLDRLRSQQDEIVYAATFDRALEESIACSVPIFADVPLIITEGNYLLVENPAWRGVRSRLDEAWFVDPGEQTRLDRLIARHQHFGRSPEEARERSLGSDQTNAELILSTRPSADKIVRVPHFANLS